MTHYSEHLKMKPALDLARKLDIATNPDPQAIFEAGSGGFQVWCTPEDHPQGWDGIQMISGSFSKPCEFVGSVHWNWEDETIVGLAIEADAYALKDQQPDKYRSNRAISNRTEDIEWLKGKVAWLFEKAGVPLLPFIFAEE
ncbi:hypothetical protein ANAEL_02062 [Anaerolineales bacterium]|nr:hypothetical protein ANAEL_02062 [Anaerolineales bacterium]